jgi:hypothetical protein
MIRRLDYERNRVFSLVTRDMGLMLKRGNPVRLIETMML